MISFFHMRSLYGEIHSFKHSHRVGLATIRRLLGKLLQILLHCKTSSASPPPSFGFCPTNGIRRFRGPIPRSDVYHRNCILLHFSFVVPSLLAWHPPHYWQNLADLDCTKYTIITLHSTTLTSSIISKEWFTHKGRLDGHRMATRPTAAVFPHGCKFATTAAPFTSTYHGQSPSM